MKKQMCPAQVLYTVSRSNQKAFLGGGATLKFRHLVPFLTPKLFLHCPFQTTPFEVFVLQEPCLLSPSPLLDGLWPLVGPAIAAMESAGIVTPFACPYLDCRCSQLGPCTPRVRFPCEGTSHLPATSSFVTPKRTGTLCAAVL